MAGLSAAPFINVLSPCALEVRIGGGAADVERRLRRLRQALRPMAARRERHAARVDRPRQLTPPVPGAAARQRGRAERGDGGAAAGGRGTLALAGERLLQRADEHAAHEAAVAKAHLGLGRVHVDVDLARIERDEQRHDLVDGLPDMSNFCCLPGRAGGTPILV
jgi:hypothetical protein